MKNFKSLFATLFLVTVSLMSFGQLINLTEANPSYFGVNQWPGGNSWNMIVPVYNDIVALNNAVASAKSNVISDSSTTRVSLLASQTGALVLAKNLAGDTIALPASSTCPIGTKFTYQIIYSVTSNTHVVVTNGTDAFYGTAFLLSTTTASPFSSTANKRIAMSTTTTGGLLGGRMEFNYLGGGLWAVTGTLKASGTAATPFAN